MDKSLQALAVKATQLDREVQVVMSFWDGFSKNSFSESTI